MFGQYSTYAEARQMVFTSKMFQKHLWKSEILSKDDLHLDLKCHSFRDVFQTFY